MGSWLTLQRTEETPEKQRDEPFIGMSNNRRREPTAEGGGAQPKQPRRAEAVSPHKDLTTNRKGWSIIQQPWSHDKSQMPDRPEQGEGKGIGAGQTN